ncbi:MAG: gamma-glutamyltransferase, partial [Candidatus Poribacteria bacterium]
ETLTNVLDHDIAPEAAGAAPRIHHQWMPNLLLVEPGISETDRNALKILGHEIQQIPGIAAVSLATASLDGSASGAGDPRKGGAALIVPARTAQ